jgi:hypothetical protein
MILFIGFGFALINVIALFRAAYAACDFAHIGV